MIDHIQGRSGTDLAGANDPILQTLERYWQALRHADRIPARNDIEPAKIDIVLPYCFIAQRVAPGTARMRVAGQKLHDLLKMDARGMPLTTFFHPQARDQIKALLESAFTEPAIMSVPLSSPGNQIRSQIDGTMLLLPLRDHDGKPSRILGALVADRKTGEGPRRFVVVEHGKIRHEQIGLKQPAFTLMPRDPVQTQRPDVARPALRLVVNNG